MTGLSQQRLEQRVAQRWYLLLMAEERGMDDAALDRLCLAYLDAAQDLQRLQQEVLTGVATFAPTSDHQLADQA